MSGNTESVKRISIYRRVLYKLKSLGFSKVFSDNLADALGISSAQVRKDFSIFELTGNKKGGYVINDLLDKLDHILGKDAVAKVIVVGCGGMGGAIMNYYGFAGEGVQIVAGFDSAPDVINPDARVPILDVNELPAFVADQGIDVAIMTVPESAAPRVFDLLLRSGVRGVLNFTPIQLQSTGGAVIRNINIVHELETLIYFIRNQSE